MGSGHSMQRTSKYLLVTTWGEGGKVTSTWREGSETWNSRFGELLVLYGWSSKYRKGVQT